MLKHPIIGASLIELLLVLAISSICMLSLTHIYLSNKESYLFQEQLAKLQERGRLLTQLLTHEIRSAGYIGCARFSNSFPVYNHSALEFSYENSLHGYSANQAIKKFDLPSTGKGSPLKNTEVILLKKMSDITASLIQPSLENTLAATTEYLFQSKDILIISDCRHAEIFEVMKSKQNNNSQYIEAKELVTPFFEGQIGYLQSEIYYVANTTRKNNANQAISALFLKSIDVRSEIMEGVEDMQIQYGINEGEEVRYFETNDVADWSKVVSVKINLLLNSVDEILKQPQTYYFMGSKKIAKDKLFHQEWFVYIFLRERNS